MPVARGMPSGSVRQMTAQLSGDTSRLDNQALQYSQAAVRMMRAKWKRLLGQLEQQRQLAEQKKFEDQASAAQSRSGIGAWAGLAASVVAAPFTGGSSLMLAPGLMSAGSSIARGSGPGGTQQDFTTGLQGFQDPLNELFTPNDPTLVQPLQVTGGIMS